MIVGLSIAGALVALWAAYELGRSAGLRHCKRLLERDTKL